MIFGFLKKNRRGCGAILRPPVPETLAVIAMGRRVGVVAARTRGQRTGCRNDFICQKSQKPDPLGDMWQIT